MKTWSTMYYCTVAGLVSSVQPNLDFYFSIVYFQYSNFNATKPNIWDCSAHCKLHHGKFNAIKSKIRNSLSHCKLHCGWPGNLSARLFLTVSLDRWAHRAHCIKRNTSTHPGQTRMIFKHRNRGKYVRITRIPKDASK